jgi:hypothetical protein
MKAEILIDREALREVVREMLAEEGTQQKTLGPPSGDIVDEATRLAIQEQMVLAHKTYLNRKEAAKYLNVSERSVGEWSARPAGQNPFPAVNAGGEPRYKRTDIDEWVRRERQRQELKVAG